MRSLFFSPSFVVIVKEEEANKKGDDRDLKKRNLNFKTNANIYKTPMKVYFEGDLHEIVLWIKMLILHVKNEMRMGSSIPHQ